MDELADLIAEKGLMRLRQQHTSKDTISAEEACAMIGCSKRTLRILKVKYPRRSKDFRLILNSCGLFLKCFCNPWANNIAVFVRD